MKKDRDIEIRERALGVLGVPSIYDSLMIRRNFLRQMRLVHPDGPGRDDERVPGFNNTEVARLLIQAYGLLTGKHYPTTMLENDRLVGAILDGQITPMSETVSDDGWRAAQFYDQFRHSIWPEPTADEVERHRRWKFQGV